ncbi:alpha/beta fold hydrolase [Rhodobacteraceae bacterium 2CG4]|uniref:Alpha/beta fold hydrolase n=1 Tax=Halovulum marinum TaxID=2662447 RepID=A0A6L5YW13_9RHOB|nr:alpha/beta fold hydrolase [Halovulum marinum]MSU88042.1 alpha/beta fold hydrolase [Halovulum marinum]
MVRLRPAALLVSLILLLAACAAGPLGNPAPITRAALTPAAVAADGTRLAMSSWPAHGRPRAVILALHGFGDFGPSTYDAAADAWAARGITTYAYDQRGFGRNDSFRRWPGPEILESDLRAVAALIRARHPDLPLIVVGHSMGGGVALAAAGDGLAADALVLAAPAIAGGDGIPPSQRFGGWLAAALAPDKRFTGKGLVRIVPTDNDAAWRSVSRNPRHFGDPSGRELMGLIRVMDRAAAAAPRVTLPTLTLMGRQDQILRTGAVRRVHRQIAGRKRFVLYDDGWHWLFRDLQAARVWDDVASFALAQRRRP